MFLDFRTTNQSSWFGCILYITNECTTRLHTILSIPTYYSLSNSSGHWFNTNTDIIADTSCTVTSIFSTQNYTTRWSQWRQKLVTREIVSKKKKQRLQNYYTRVVGWSNRLVRITTDVNFKITTADCLKSSILCIKNKIKNNLLLVRSMWAMTKFDF